MVGYNRRFSPLATVLKQAMHPHDGPMVINYRVNAGPVPSQSWIQDPEVGGGRIVGEVCHFVDFMRFLTDADPIEVFAQSLGSSAEPPGDPDNLCIQLRFRDGSLGILSYVATGDPAFPKERIEVFGGGLTGVIDNWRRVLVTGHGRKVRSREWLSAAKGHSEELVAFVAGIRSGAPPISFESLVLTTQTTFAIQRSLRTGRPIFALAQHDDESSSKGMDPQDKTEAVG
jgi:polar amino acid transport system substrate-binding protein